MTDEIRVSFSAKFLRKVKDLRKKFRPIDDDVRDFVERLKAAEAPGDRLQNVSQVVYKVRVQNRDLQRGKSGGYRMIYYIKTSTHVILVTIYAKSEQSDIDAMTLSAILAEIDSDT